MDTAIIEQILEQMFDQRLDREMSNLTTLFKFKYNLHLSFSRKEKS